jgi:tetrahydromethanopterin S-methyltransferase subunit G
MSVVEDIRQALQDCIAPELRAIGARFDVVDAKFDAVNARFDAREKVSEARFNELSSRLQTLQNTVTLNDLEHKQALTKMYQDFQFDKRLAGIEQELQRNRSTAA